MEDRTYDIVDSVEKLQEALKKTREAQRIFAGYTQEQVDKIFLAAASAANKARIPLAKMAVSETGMGVVEDKVIKNHYASEYIYNAYKHEKTCGVLEEDPSYDPIRKPLPFLENRLSPAEVKERLEIAGPEQLICRCEQVSRAVIEETLKRGIPIHSVDAIKRRTRASMGACQGGFCRGRFLKVVKELTGRDLDPRTDIEKEGVKRVSRAEFLDYYGRQG